MYYLDMLAETLKQKSFFSFIFLFPRLPQQPQSHRCLCVCGSSWSLAHCKRKRSSLGSDADPRTELIGFS